MGVTTTTEHAHALGKRLIHYTPLRYPGGKAKLTDFVKAILEQNELVDGHYVEPYAGGSGIALELLFHEYVSHIHINDVSKPVYSFWKSVLCHADKFAKLVRDTRPSVREWDKQKKVLSNPKDHDELALGFATFFINRTNRSGILNGGIIGGRDQTGPWKIDARYNPKELAFRIESIAALNSRISVYCDDAITFLTKGLSTFPEKTLIYLDPPYYVKGKDLYPDFYRSEDHIQIAHFVSTQIRSQKWIVSYDNVSPIRRLYKRYRHIVYQLGYSAREARTGTEAMFFCDDIRIPAADIASKAIRILSRHLRPATH